MCGAFVAGSMIGDSIFELFWSRLRVCSRMFAVLLVTSFGVLSCCFRSSA